MTPRSRAIGPSRRFASAAGACAPAVLALGALAAPPAAPPPAPAAPASAQPSAPAPADAPRASRAAAVNAETFDTVWAIVRDTHWDPALGGVDWEAVRAELRPRAQAAATPDALRAVLAEMLARLGQSHFAILPGEVLAEAEPEPADSHAPPRPSEAAPPSPDGAAPESGTGDAQSAAEGERPRAPTRARRPAARGGHPGAHLALLPAPDPTAPMEAVVVRVDPDSSAARAGLTPGTVVLSINDHAATRHLPEGGGLARYERAAIVRARGTGEPGSTATWRVRTAAGEERDVVLEYAEDPRPRVPFGNLPPFPVALEWGTVPAALTERDGAAGARIGRIAFSGWFFPVARPFDEAMDALRSADGIVLDLRGNPGGLGGMAMGIAGHFTAAPERLGTMRTREGELNFVTNPRTVSTTGESVAVYTGPVAILVDETTASTSEIFAGGMQHLGRARIFGRRTAGAALPAVLDELPNGDVFLHAIADFRLPSGGALEAEGVRPDLDRVYTRLDYDRDGDPILADAIRWIGAETRRVAADRAPGTPDAPGPQTPTPRTTEHTP